MSKRDFFILIIKLFGLYSIITSLFSGLPSQLYFISQSFDPLSLTIGLISVSLIIGLFIFLISKANKVVCLLKLEKGFEEDRIEIGKLDSEQIAKIGAFIVGGLVFLNHLPTFLSQTIFSFKASQMGLVQSERDKMLWLADGLNIVIGYLLLTNFEYVGKRIGNNKKNRHANNG